MHFLFVTVVSKYCHTFELYVFLTKDAKYQGIHCIVMIRRSDNGGVNNTTFTRYLFCFCDLEQAAVSTHQFGPLLFPVHLSITSTDYTDCVGLQG
jgi:hypothetical protein